MINFLEQEPALVMALFINFFLILIIFIISISNRVKLKKLKEKYMRFMNSDDDLSIEQLLDKCIDKLNSVNAKNKEIEVKINSIERNLIYCVQKVGVVRFNAFDNVGSDLSYSIAILDSNDNGVVISSLYARDSSSTYAKPIVGGKSKYALSAEELKAIDMAKKTHSEIIYTG